MHSTRTDRLTRLPMQISLISSLISYKKHAHDTKRQRKPTIAMIVANKHRMGLFWLTLLDSTTICRFGHYLGFFNPQRVSGEYLMDVIQRTPPLKNRGVLR